MAPREDDPFRVNQPGAVALDKPGKRRPERDEDDESEWEYEYCSTETETYYLTVDLSIPEFSKRTAPLSTLPARHTYYSRGGQNRQSVRVHQKKLAATNRDVDADDNLNDANDDDDVDAGLEHLHPDFRPAPKHEGEIQILDLHSSAPLISYRGKVFRASWAENLGSELIFAARDPSAPLPAVHPLPGGVDILAAASARLMTTELALAPRAGARPGGGARGDAFDRAVTDLKREHGIHIAPGSDKTGERREQAHFLEALEAVKRRRGEADGVTVSASGSYERVFGRREDPDYKPRKRRAPNAPAAREKLRRGRPGRPPGPSRRGRAGGPALHGGDISGQRRVAQAAHVGPIALAGDGGLSLPTPQRWTDLPSSSRVPGPVVDLEGEDDEDPTRHLFEGVVLGRGGK